MPITYILKKKLKRKQDVKDNNNDCYIKPESTCDNSSSKDTNECLWDLSHRKFLPHYIILVTHIFSYFIRRLILDMRLAK